MSRPSLLSAELASLATTEAVASLLEHSIKHMVGVIAEQQLTSIVVKLWPALD
jgi:hypothetical protein